jgi:hypothetical protein
MSNFDSELGRAAHAFIDELLEAKRERRRYDPNRAHEGVMRLLKNERNARSNAPPHR